jgi:uncharacterized protein
VNPFFFGSRDRALFGTLHPPRTRSGRREGAVLCGPFGVEYMRSHRAFRQLTTLLTRGGYHVLRFDYGGTGDSAGEGEAQTLEQWTDDVSTAIEELRDTAGLDQVTVVGLRLGAALALQAAARGGSGGVGVDRLVLWDPVADGERWLAEVLPAGVEATARELSAPGGSGVVGVSGFPLPLALFQELRTLLPDGAGVPPGTPVELVVSRADPMYDGLERRLAGSGLDVRHHVIPSEGNWAEGDAFGSALLPQGIIQGIVDLLVGSGEEVR